MSEWCWDVYDGYADGAVTDPVGASSGPYRVSRGGYWFSSAAHARAASRDANDPGDRDVIFGVRLSRTIA